MTKFRILLACCLSLPLAAAAVHAEPVRCRRAIAKESAKNAQSVMKALQRCEDKKAAGSLPASTNCQADPTATASIQKAASRLHLRIAQRCGGGDHICGNADDDPLASIGWGSIGTCPNFENGSCAGPIASCADIATCLECIDGAAVRQAVTLYYGAFQQAEFGTSSQTNRCQRAIGKETARFFTSKSKALVKCWDARLKGAHNNACPSPGDGKAAAKIAKAELRKQTKICGACGGGNGACGGGDDLTPGQIGFAPSCPAVTVPAGPSCGGPVAVLQDIVDCVDCVSEYKVDCIEAAGVPGLASYPSECSVPPASTSTTTSTTTTTVGITLPTTTTTTVVVATSTTTTLPPCPPPPIVPLGSLTFTINPGTTNCGGPGLVPPPSAPFSGEVDNIDNSKRSDLGLGCLYFGGGGANAFPPARIPDGAQSVLDVAGISGLAIQVTASDGSGPADCTKGAGPGMRCLNGAAGTDTMGACTSDADCDGGVTACDLEANCFFGPPVPVPASGLSVCIVNGIAADICGTADLLTNSTTLAAGLTSRIYLTGDNASPCPRCVSGTCTAGDRAGLACSGGVGSGGTSLECPPTAVNFIGRLGVTLAPLTTGTTTLTSPTAVFCPSQRTPGAFGGEAGTIRETGAPLLGGLNLFDTTLAGVFCVPATGSPLINAVGDLPGPGAVSVPGTAEINLL